MFDMEWVSKALSLNPVEAGSGPDDNQRPHRNDGKNSTQLSRLTSRAWPRPVTERQRRNKRSKGDESCCRRPGKWPAFSALREQVREILCSCAWRLIFFEYKWSVCMLQRLPNYSISRRYFCGSTCCGSGSWPFACCGRNMLIFSSCPPILGTRQKGNTQETAGSSMVDLTEKHQCSTRSSAMKEFVEAPIPADPP